MCAPNFRVVDRLFCRQDARRRPESRYFFYVFLGHALSCITPTSSRHIDGYPTMTRLDHLSRPSCICVFKFSAKMPVDFASLVITLYVYFYFLQE